MQHIIVGIALEDGDYSQSLCGESEITGFWITELAELLFHGLIEALGDIKLMAKAANCYPLGFALGTGLYLTG